MQKNRDTSLDCLRAVACVAIILLHSIYTIRLMFSAGMTAGQVVACRTVQNNLMWAVPCFLMVTGALLLEPEKQIGYKTLFSRYIARALKALVVFCTVFVLFEMAVYPADRTKEYFFSGLWEIFTGQSWSHMWYLYCLLGLYLLLPAYKKIAAASEEKDIRYLLIVYGVFQSLLPLLNLWEIPYGFYIHVSTIYPFWLFLGYWLHRWGRDRSRALYGALFVVSTVLLAALTRLRMDRGLEAMDKYLFDYTSPLVIGQAAGIAGWFFQCRPDKFREVKRTLRNIDEHSFGIYLIHVLYIRLMLETLGFDPLRYGLALGTAAVVAAAFAAAYVTDVVMKRLPLFRSIV